MQKKIVAIMLFASFFWRLHAAEDPQEALQLANAAFRSGDYTQAIAAYETLEDSGWHSADLYYNLGTSYLQNKQLGPAILNFERALLYAPADSDIQHNLQIARQQLTDDISEVPEFFLRRWWRNWSIGLSSNSWTIIGLLLIWGGIAGLVMWLMGWQRSLRKWGFLGGIPLLIVGFLLLALAFSRMNIEQNSNFAILQEAQMTLYTAPDESSNALFELHEGTKVEILDQIGEWYKIRLLNGDEGWLPAKFMERI